MPRLLLHLKKTIGIAILFLMTLFVYGQDDCTLKLNQAQKLYEEGKIESIPALIHPCMENGFNKENKIAALRLLALVSIFEDKQDEAEEHLLRILKLNPEYTYNEAIDPIDYIRIYKSINTEPVFSIGGELGFNLASPYLVQTYSSTNYDEANPVYKSNGVGIHLGVIGIYHLKPNLDLAIEPTYSSYNYSLSENISANSVVFNEEVISYLNLPLLAKYSFYQKKDISYFAEGGLCYGMYLDGTMNLTKSHRSNETPPVTGSSVSSNELRKDANVSGLIGIGTKIKLSRSNLQLSVRGCMGFMNLMYTENRYNDIEESFSKYQFIDNNFRLNTVSLHISYNYEFYNHKHKK